VIASLVMIRRAHMRKAPDRPCIAIVLVRGGGESAPNLVVGSCNVFAGLRLSIKDSKIDI
jgi:hypothetical protein